MLSQKLQKKISFNKKSKYIQNDDTDNDIDTKNNDILVFVV
jgi:hypothetical protein